MRELSIDAPAAVAFMMMVSALPGELCAVTRRAPAQQKNPFSLPPNGSPSKAALAAFIERPQARFQIGAEDER